MGGVKVMKGNKANRKLLISDIKLGNDESPNGEKAINYHIHAAALAFHKSLFGISELKAINELSKQHMPERFLGLSKGVITYYSVYHLFCMIIIWHKLVTD